MTRVTSLFRNGTMQAVRIPKDLELPEGKVTIARQSDGSLVVRPHMSLVEYFSGRGPLPEEEWMDPIEDPPAEPIEL